ncbi:peptidoglycan DD-metalloendopeptidase family protein [Nocardia amamiensis]|uniref:Peptidoglycan DD-metalloendopeptidase family protein n=1 Tax=Nocardia amamiensis TaxID=404578 RepID=A0ABS0CP31_9NOCA|nr:peptidoglycan DD-metalloendopeptidase family protein [Nocardia amamiensis]
MLEKARLGRLDRVRGVGGIGVIPRDWRARPPKRTDRRVFGRQYRRVLWARRSALRTRWKRRPDLRALWRRRPSGEDVLALARKHRVLLAGLGAAAVFAASDTSFAGTVTERTPAPDRAQRVAIAYPPQVQSTPPSVRRLLNAIANGERLREQAVVAAAARATLDRAKAEAAAATAGEHQPWMTGSAPVQPGAALPGTGGFVLPTRGMFTSGFGSRWGTFHNGIDIAAPIGTPIYAVADGTVIDAGPAQGFGLWVRIRHDDGSITVYGHMYDFFVSVGERVPAGMQIARMGNRGDSTGPHLHFEVLVGGRHVDPVQWLALRGLTFS